ncbi:hypothetical protein BGZ61DRAFT_348901, partial [Ilyonectria robusta]|uniref:uncharacterized protein n=1 Tax=Ilyonectria robusta TaxID=1079257 RepID=UPI001E8DB4DA
LLRACPVWKLNPSKHNDCFKAKLGKISRVKQHMARKHTPAFYCERCLVIFSDKQSHQGHIRHSHRTWDSSMELDGISHEQHRELSHKSKPNLSESENWFRIWGIVFPNQPPPASAFMDPDLSEDLCRFREFFQRQGPATLVEELRTNGISSLADEDVTLSLHEILNRGLNRLYQEWLSTTTPSARPASPRSGRTRPTRLETPVSSLADSGVEIRSQELSCELGGYDSSGSRSTDRIQQSDTLHDAHQSPTSLESIIAIAAVPDNNHRFDINESWR